jgi:hypothetical protein
VSSRNSPRVIGSGFHTGFGWMATPSRAGLRLSLAVDPRFRGNDGSGAWCASAAAKRARPGGLFIALLEGPTNRTADKARSAVLTC